MFPRTYLLSFALASACACFAQITAPAIEPSGAAHPPNANVIYQALRGSLPSGDGLAVKDFTLEREGGTFHFDQGSFYLYGPINNRVTGAVFSGKGHFSLAPKDVSEQHSLALLTKSGIMQQDFTTLVLRFTDGTAEEIRKASTGTAGPLTAQIGSTAHDLARGFRERLHANIELQILNDVLNAQQGGYFLASFRMGGTFSGRNVLFIVDPDDSPDQVSLSTWSDDDSQAWAAYKMEHLPQDGGTQLHVSAEKIETTFDRSGKMTSSAETTLTAHREALRVLQLNLYPTLRVSGVYDEKGQPLDFVQEDKKNDPAFAIILPAPVKAGTTLRILTKYAGPDAVRRDGEDVYYLMPGARESWYPSGNSGLGDYALYRMTFHLSKNLQIVATGKQVSVAVESGGMQRVVWESQSPIPVAGFNLGSFKSTEEKTPQGFSVSAYANVNLPDYAAGLANGSLGTMSTVSMLPVEVSQGSAAIQVYTQFFGKLPYDHVALTQQSACNFGQSWPMLVYLPTCAFWDSTIQNSLGLLSFGGSSYWKEVTPHEVSHQWWGQLVGFNSYRDQWMSEGFANFSTGLFLLQTSKKMDDYRAFWNEQHKDLMEKNQFGVRPVDVGPLTMGERVSNEKTGNVYQLLIYSKGAYVLHMLEMMYWTPQYQQEPFKRSLQTFVSEYAGKAATTEDFQHSFERTMPKWLDLQGNGKLDWFFNEYVYGTELPHYVVSSDFSVADGETSVHVKVQQSNVSKDFVVLMPIYLQMENGLTVRIANIILRGGDTFDKTLKLGKLPSAGKKILINYNADILSD